MAVKWCHLRQAERQYRVARPETITRHALPPPHAADVGTSNAKLRRSGSRNAAPLGRGEFASRDLSLRCPEGGIAGAKADRVRDSCSRGESSIRRTAARECCRRSRGQDQDGDRIIARNYPCSVSRSETCCG